MLQQDARLTDQAQKITFVADLTYKLVIIITLDSKYGGLEYRGTGNT